MDEEKKLIQNAISLLEDQASPLLKQEMRYEADGTPYIVLLQDQGIKGTKKFIFTIPEIEAYLAAREALEAAKAEVAPEPEPKIKVNKPKGKTGANK